MIKQNHLQQDESLDDLRRRLKNNEPAAWRVLNDRQKAKAKVSRGSLHLVGCMAIQIHDSLLLSVWDFDMPYGKADRRLSEHFGKKITSAPTFYIAI